MCCFKKGHPKDMCSKEIGLSTQKLLTILSSLVNINWGGAYRITQRAQESSLWYWKGYSYDFQKLWDEYNPTFLMWHLWEMRKPSYYLGVHIQYYDELNLFVMITRYFMRIHFRYFATCTKENLFHMSLQICIFPLMISMWTRRRNQLATCTLLSFYDMACSFIMYAKVDSKKCS